MIEEIITSWFGGPLEQDVNGIARHVFHINGLKKSLNLGGKVEQYKTLMGFIDGYIDLVRNSPECNYEIIEKYEGVVDFEKELEILQINNLNQAYYNKLNLDSCIFDPAEYNNFENESFLIKEIDDFFLIHEIKPLKGIESLKILPASDCDEWGYMVKCPICDCSVYGKLDELQDIKTCMCYKCIEEIKSEPKITLVIKLKSNETQNENVCNFSMLIRNNRASQLKIKN